MLTVKSLRKAVPGGRVLFQDLNLTVDKGQFVAITGESGVGKSTLLNVLAGLDSADAGSVAIDGVAMESLQDDALTRLRRDRIGFVFQAFHVLPHANAFVAFLYYALAGTLWTIPIGLMFPWMQREPTKRRTP